MIRSRNLPTVSAERIPWYLMGFGVAVGVVVLAEVVLFLFLNVHDVSDAAFLVGTFTTVPFLLGITYGAYWLWSSDLSTCRYPRVALWCLGGLCAFFLMNATLVATLPTGSWAETFSWLRWSVTVGAGVGMLVGVIEGRAIQRAISAERAVVRSQYLERQRDMLQYLNSILRHEVLNAATAIDGYASRLLEEEPDLDEDSEQWLAIIMDETQDMSSVIDDVRVLLRRTSGDHELRRLHLSRAVEEAVRDLRTDCESVTVETAVPDDVFVRADDMLARVFGNLLSNAVEHNDAATPHVSIECERTTDTARIDIADNGPGVPDAEVDSLFEPNRRRDTTHGLGLYLVRELVENYDGAIELSETGPEGSRFTVELPRAPSDWSSSSERSATGALSRSTQQATTTDD